MTFSASEPVKMDEAFIQCTLSRIEYDELPVLEDGSPSNEDLSLRGDGTPMKSLRPATDKDLEMIAAAAKELEDYQALKAAEEAKGKKVRILDLHLHHVCYMRLLMPKMALRCLTRLCQSLRSLPSKIALLKY